jgi:ABC-type Na+ efflux pump permease subunit
MREKALNIFIRMSFLLFPLIIGFILLSTVTDNNINRIINILFIPITLLGQAIFHFRGKVFIQYWRSRRECTVWGILYLLSAIIFFILECNEWSTGRVKR